MMPGFGLGTVTEVPGETPSGIPSELFHRASSDQRSEISKIKELCRLLISEFFIPRLFAGASDRAIAFILIALLRFLSENDLENIHG